MKEKKSFLFYYDWCGLLLKLNEDLRHRSLDALLRYVSEGTEPTEPDLIGIFGFMRLQIDRDTERWNEERAKKSEAGKKGMRSRWGASEADSDTKPDNDVITQITPDNDVITQITPDNDVITQITPDNDVITQIPPDNDVITQIPPDNDVKDTITKITDIVIDKVKVIDTDKVTDKAKEKDDDKEIKRVRAAFVKPTLKQVQNEMDFAARMNGVTLDPYAEAQAFMDYYSSNGWHVGRNPMRDWQAAVRGWIRRKTNTKPKNYANTSTTPADNIADAQREQLMRMAATLRAANV